MLKTKGRAHIMSIEIARSTKLEVNIVRHDDDRDYIDVRTWFANIYAGGAWTPTKKGVHFPLDKADKIIEAINMAKHFDPKELVQDSAKTEQD